ncbi:MAG: V-type ATP synthase subunit I [Treponema sp.]|jgi:V/A-type H+-transporting ATPase subunit I|nr:V-type ATP synthase subunit I [Treponema sp.]
MKHVDLTVLSRDVDRVIEYLGRRGIMQFSEGGETQIPEKAGVREPVGREEPEQTAGLSGIGLRGGAPEVLPRSAGAASGEAANTAGGKDPDAERRMSSLHSLNHAASRHIQDNLERFRSAAAFLGVELPAEPEENTMLPAGAEEVLAAKLQEEVSGLINRENEAVQEKRKVEEALNEARAFANLNAPFAELDQLSYLTLRLGRLDLKAQEQVRRNLADRAVIIALGEGERILAAASRRGRFALDSELKKAGFVSIAIPEGYQGIPPELLEGLENRLAVVKADMERIREDKEVLARESGPHLRSLTASYLMAAAVEQIKEKLTATRNIYVLSGWAPQDAIAGMVGDLTRITEKRIAVRTYTPEEMPGVAEGREKVPVSLKHGAYVRGFERVVFSYGAPLYGTIDPTPFVAVFFSILFGIMFGDLGQGFVLFLLGLLTGAGGSRALKNFHSYSTPLIAVGIASMVMGLLTGEVFAIEGLLSVPTRAVTGFFMNIFGIAGEPPERILHLMPEKGDVLRLFYFFGFTISVGVILNSIGLVVNILNLFTLKRYEKAVFSKTGLAGLLFFWYAIFIAVRCITGGRFAWFDLAGLLIPVFGIFFGPVLWPLVSGERPVLKEGLMVFIMEGFVEILETLSTYVSNTVSFLRVGAFALSHAVLSFIVFTLSGMVSHGVAAAGPLFALVVMVFGNAIIIVLEGMVVAIQVVRLQYYEFFSKFFTETGVAFAPFRFRKEARG